MIHHCSCSSAWQDKRYGKGMRVHNSCTNSNPGQMVIRCTVCKTEKTVNK